MTAHSNRAWLLVLALPCLTCSHETSLPSPTVRVDLRHRLPEKELRRLQLADTTYECHRAVELRAQGAGQRFIITYKLLPGEGGKRHITVVQVAPDGPFTGARGPVASAVVGEGKGGVVPVEIKWEATKGCSTISAGTRVVLRADDPACKAPRPAGKIFQ